MTEKSHPIQNTYSVVLLVKDGVAAFSTVANPEMSLEEMLEESRDYAWEMFPDEELERVQIVFCTAVPVQTYKVNR